jgi:hypothetical protein
MPIFCYKCSWNRNTTTQKTETKQIANGNRTSTLKEQGKPAVSTIKLQRSFTDAAIKVEKADNDEMRVQDNKLRDGSIGQIGPTDIQNGLNTNEKSQLANEQLCCTSTKDVIVRI